MPDHDDPAGSWLALVEAINGQPEPARQASWLLLRTFVHDMRQSLGQVQSAEGILRRLLAEAPLQSELIEMLNIVQSASKQAAVSLDEFTASFVERIEME